MNASICARVSSDRQNGEPPMRRSVRWSPGAWLGLAAVALLGFLSSCGKDEYTWAFAQDIDNSFNPNETCRESLAASLYAPGNEGRTMRQGDSNVFLFNGFVERYRIYAYHSQSECETALTGLKNRQGR